MYKYIEDSVPVKHAYVNIEWALEDGEDGEVVFVTVVLDGRYQVDDLERIVKRMKDAPRQVQ